MPKPEPDNVVPLPEPDPYPAIAKRGLGYIGIWRRNGIVLDLSKVRGTRHELSGLLTATSSRGPMFTGTFNVFSGSTRKSTANYISQRDGTDPVLWIEILEQFCRHVIRLADETEEPEDVDAEQALEDRPALLAPWLPMGVPTVLYGPGEAGKSTLAAAVLVALCAGVEVADWVPQQGHVLVLDYESDRHAWVGRVAAIARALGIVPPKFGYWRGSSPLMDVVEPVARYVAEREVRLIIVDSTTGAVDDDYNGGVHSPIKRLHDALRHVGATSLLVDHVTKDSATNGRKSTGPINSIMKINQARSAWEVRGEEAPPLPGQQRQVLMHHYKVNEGPRLPDQGIGITWAKDWRSCELRRCEITAPELQGALSLEKRIRQLLAGSGALRPAIIADELGAREDSIRASLRRGEGFVKLGSGAWGLSF